MKLDRSALLLAVFTLTGCSSTPVTLDKALPVDNSHLYAFQEKTPDASASILITRDAAFVAGGCRLGFYINGEIAADFKVSQKASFYLVPGEYRLGSGPAKDAHGLCATGPPPVESETRLTSGQVKRFRMFIDQDGNKDVRPQSDD
jgi:hypothetical protein